MSQAPLPVPKSSRRDLRAALLVAAEELFAVRPYEEVTAEEIAQEAGVAKGLLYYHFVSKRGIYEAVVQALADDLEAITQLDLSLPPRERTAASLDAFIAWAEARQTFRSAVMGGTSSSGMIQTIVTAALDKQVELVMAGIQAAADEQGATESIATPTLLLAIKGWTAFVGMTTIDWLIDPELSAEELRNLMMRALAGVFIAGTTTGQTLPQSR
ncbi:MAG: TetR/AcrR family transcriptional regulator [Thermoleophilaceae bacterium]|nr:TetR/AcrR family transcriptional regulator [Thermoleophilaceae bacterium]